MSVEAGDRVGVSPAVPAAVPDKPGIPDQALAGAAVLVPTSHAPRLPEQLARSPVLLMVGADVILATLRYPSSGQHGQAPEEGPIPHICIM
jgi:hypothetical protein